MQWVLELGPASIVFWAVSAAWLAEPLVFPSQGDRGEDATGRRERFGIVAAILAAFAVTAVCHRFGVGNLQEPVASGMRGVGLVLYAAGAVLRYASARALGGGFTRDVHVGEDLEMVSRGPYRWLRHPLYVGLFMLGTGLPLLFANLPGALLGAPGIAAAIATRARREEDLLRSRLNGRYQLWASSRRRLLPGLF